MPGDKAENKAASTEDNSGNFFSDLAFDLLKGYNTVKQAEAVVTGGLLGGVAGGMLMGQGMHSIGEAAAKGAAKCQAKVEEHRDNPVLNTIIPGFGFWERAAETTAHNVVDHVKANPVRAGIEMLVPPLLIFDANIRKLWGN